MPFDDLLHASGFRAGIAAGAAALLVVIAAFVLRAVKRGRLAPLPLAGPALVVASLVGLRYAGGGIAVSGRLVAGLVLLAAGGLASTLRPSWPATLAATIPGAAMVAWAADAGKPEGWVPPLVLGATALGGALVADFDETNADAGLGPVLVALTVVAAYASLPDTEQVGAAVGAALPVALLGFPLPVASLGRAGATSSVGLLAWIAAVGGRGRSGAIVAAIACLGVMILEPIVRRVLGERIRPPARALSLPVMLVVGLHTGLVAGTSLTAGRKVSGGSAAAVALPALAAAAVALAVLLLTFGARTRGSALTQTTGRRRGRSPRAAHTTHR